MDRSVRRRQFATRKAQGKSIQGVFRRGGVCPDLCWPEERQGRGWCVPRSKTVPPRRANSAAVLGASNVCRSKLTRIVCGVCAPGWGCCFRSSGRDSGCGRSSLPRTGTSSACSREGDVAVVSLEINVPYGAGSIVKVSPTDAAATIYLSEMLQSSLAVLAGTRIMCMRRWTRRTGTALAGTTPRICVYRPAASLSAACRSRKKRITSWYVFRSTPSTTPLSTLSR